MQDSEPNRGADRDVLVAALSLIEDGVIITDTGGKVLFINRVAEELTGWNSQEALSKGLTDVFQLLEPGTRQRAANPIQGVVEHGGTAALAKRSVLASSEGGERLIEGSCSALRSRDGRTIGVVLVFRDITERLKTEDELLRASKLESVGLLAGGIAHDFNNVLTAIIGNLSLAKMTVSSPEKVTTRLAEAEKASLRAKDLTQQLLTFARGGAPIKKTVQMGDLIRDAAQLSLHGTNVQCEFVIPPDLWPVDADQGQIRQVINNLVNNAKQAMPDGGRVEVLATNTVLSVGQEPPLAAGRYVKITTRDHGGGIAPENLPKIFDPYFSTKKHGSGLGLATAYSVIRKHDGVIKVESALGQGTAFHIYLPASTQPLATSAPEPTEKDVIGHGRVLVMDDEPDIRLVASEMLKTLGYEVDLAADGGEAIERYLSARSAGKPFVAVVMDLTIPTGMGGKEAIKRLKELDPSVKAIVSSGYSYDPVMANFREYGFGGVVTKPYQINDLGRALKEMLEPAKSPAESRK